MLPSANAPQGYSDDDRAFKNIRKASVQRSAVDGTSFEAAAAINKYWLSGGNRL